MNKAWLQIVVLAMLASPHAAGQNMYRCGNKYQDSPCDAGQKGRTVGTTGVAGASSAAASSGAAAAECAQQAKDSMRVVWGREGGATQERLLADAKTERERALIRDVWRRPGPASIVSKAVEADCLVQKEKEERAALLMEEALRARREAGGTAPAAAAAPVRDSPPRQESVRRETEIHNAEMKRRNCSRMGQELKAVEDRQRVGGNVAAMERFAEERRQVQARMRSEGC